MKRRDDSKSSVELQIIAVG